MGTLIRSCHHSEKGDLSRSGSIEKPSLNKFSLAFLQTNSPKTDLCSRSSASGPSWLTVTIRAIVGVPGLLLAAWLLAA